MHLGITGHFRIKAQLFHCLVDILQPIWLFNQNDAICNTENVFFFVIIKAFHIKIPGLCRKWGWVNPYTVRLNPYEIQRELLMYVLWLTSVVQICSKPITQNRPRSHNFTRINQNVEWNWRLDILFHREFTNKSIFSIFVSSKKIEQNMWTDIDN